MQSTRPQTLSYALTDSPVGQLAWIVEKFREWTDSEELPEEAVDRDLMLTNVMLYWLTGTAGSSARVYYERAHARGERIAAPQEPSTVPTAVASFFGDPQIPLRHKAERTENIVRWIVDPKAVDSLTAMPVVGVSEAQARDIAAYLYTLR